MKEGGLLWRFGVDDGDGDERLSEQLVLECSR